MTVTAVTPSGLKVRATYREDTSAYDAGYVRKAGKIISGRIVTKDGQTVFTPVGKNAFLLQ